MDIAALHDIVHKSRDARRSQTLPKFSPAERETLIKKYHPDHREPAYRPIKFGPNAGDRTVRELASILEGDSPVPDDITLIPDYTVDVLVVGGGGAGCSAALHTNHGPGLRSSSRLLLLAVVQSRERGCPIGDAEADVQCTRLEHPGRVGCKQWIAG